MKKMFCFVVFLIMGCGASKHDMWWKQYQEQVRATRRGESVDGRKAINQWSHECDSRVSSKEDYTKCRVDELYRLEHPEVPKTYLRAVNLETGICEPNRQGATPKDFDDCLTVKINELKGSQATTKVAEPKAPSVPKVQPPPPVPRGYIPGASGAVCETNPQLQFEVTNDKPGMLIGVRTPRVNGRIVGPQYVAPLHCDAPYKLMPVRVINFDGSVEDVHVIPPGVTAKFVVQPFNGGLGEKVGIDFVGYLWNQVTAGPQVPSQQIVSRVVFFRFPKTGNYAIADSRLF